MSRGTYKELGWLYAWTRAFATLALVLCALVLPRTAPALSVQMSSFDHDQTVFPLRDAHRLLDCENCHQRATFKGLSPECRSCHRLGQIAATYRRNDHMPTSDQCQQCHSTKDWTTVIRTDHKEVSAGRCDVCHNGTQAPGKSPVHPDTASDCGTCHTTAEFASAIFNHTGVTTDCVRCHNNANASGKDPGHMPTNDRCEDCHTPGSWWNAHLDHSDITPGTSCATCHNGTRANGKSPTHIVTSEDCGACHSTTTWNSAVFNHTGVTSDCATCHDGTHAQGKGGQHLSTSNTCETCHTPLGWSPATKVDHSQVNGVCSSCHDGATHDGVVVTGRPAKTANGQPHPATGECSDCHVPGDPTWKANPHTPANLANGCFSCHNGTSAVTKGPAHLGTSTRCESCHGTTAWSPRTAMDHTQVTQLTPCIACHDGAVHDAITVEGKGQTHLPTFAGCDSCHSTSAWTPVATFAHTGITSGCIDCHTGTFPPALGKNQATHIASSTRCQMCHQGTTVWTPLLPAQVDHTQVTGNCTSCHGSPLTLDTLTTETKPLGHLSTTSECSVCHTTTAWKPASGFDHQGISTGCSAAGCHVDGRTSSPLGRGANHLATNTNCEDCHAIGVSFTPQKTVKHADLSALTPCKSCHDGGTHDGITVTGKTQNHIPTTADCGGCHVGAETSLSFVGGTFDHTGTTSGCATCHDKVHEQGMSPTHIATTADCVTCHATAAALLSWTGGTFNHAGTTTGCVTCHDGSHAPANGKGPSHVLSTNSCELCHTDSAVTQLWTSTPTSGHMDHGQLSSVTPCAKCHATTAGSSLTIDGMTVTGRPTNTASGDPHPATGDCNACHSTTGWTGVTFAHSGVTNGCSASGCHVDRNTSPPLGRAASHIATNTNCQDCHSIGGTFTPHTTVKHADITNVTPCANCHDGAVHDGVTVTGKTQNHIPTGADCATCHAGAETSLSWVGGVFDHTGTTSGCATCHDGTHAGGTGPLHIGTTTLCEACHSNAAATLSWLSTPTTGNVDHNQITNTVPCTACHANAAGTSLTIDGMLVTGRPVNLPGGGSHPVAGDCGGCHNRSNWQGASFDHTGVTSGCAAAGCHTDGRTSSPLGRAASHIATNTNCQDCHYVGVAFTPHTTVKHADITALTPCASCHDGAVHDGITITGKNSPHIPTNVPSATDCGTCHVGAQNSLNWAGGVYHSKVTVTSGCLSCHDGSLVAAGADGKGTNHVASSTNCEKCHGTSVWSPAAVVDHTQVTGTCVSCHDNGVHDGKIVGGKGPEHIGSSNTCEGCHTNSAATRDWTSTPTAGNVPHTLITNTTPCTTCHVSGAASSVVDGMTVQGRPVTVAGGGPHPTSGECALCHGTSNWSSVSYDHAGVSGGCSNSGCHVDGRTSSPLGRSANHFATNTNCQDCHYAGTYFTPRAAVKHADFTSLTPCATCHDGATHDGITVTGKTTNHITTSADCTTCHAGAENTLSWVGGTFDHTGTTNGCSGCHDNVKHAGKGPQHIASSQLCEVCHTDSASTLSWTSTPTAGNVPHVQITNTSPCTTCHSSGAPSGVVDGMTVQGRPLKKADNTAHPGTGDCAACHNTTTWTSVNFDHAGVSNNCTQSGCHTDGNNSPPLGRSANHFATNTNCQDCHSIGGTFTPQTTVKHADFTSLTPCAACHDGAVHDGITVTGKSTPHIPVNVPSATDCGTCHTGAETALSWTGGLYHSKVTVTSGCTTCHDGSQTAAGAQAKGTNHIASSNSCEKCHGTSAWHPLSGIDHTQVTGTCVSCHDNASHDGLVIGGKGPKHVASSNTCDGCHTNSATTLLWTSTPTAGNMPHALLTSTVPCTTCHSSNAASSVVDGMTVQGRPTLQGNGTTHPGTGDCSLCHSTEAWTNAAFTHAGVSSGCSASGCHVDGNNSPPLGRSANHFATNTNCQDCHNVGGTFTPRKTALHADFTTLTPCAACHDGAVHDGITVTGKSTPHIPTNVPSANDCGTCHTGAQTSLSWTGGQFHAKVPVTSGCTTCHDGTLTAAGAQGKGTNHIASSNTCQKCHGTALWSPAATVDHTQVTGTCVSCHDNAVHDGLFVAGRGPQHIASSDSCNGCHTNSASTLSWISSPTSGNVPHVLITNTVPCTTCHSSGAPSSVVDGMTVQGRPVLKADNTAHPTSGDCSGCHNTSNWTGVVFDHSGVTSGCSNSGCHTDRNTSPPLGRSASHFATNTSCQDCHNVGGSFTPHTTVKHADFSALTPCASCHDGAVHDGITVTGKNTPHIPTNIPSATDCTTCHAGSETSLSWTGGVYHSKVTVTSGCATCHGGSLVSTGAQAKGTTHISSTSNCEKCHGTGVWSPAAVVDHTQVTGSCVSCHDNATHNGQLIAGKGPNHIVSSNTCDGCHTNSASTRDWTTTPTAGNVPHALITNTSPCTTCHASGAPSSVVDGMTVQGRPATVAGGGQHPQTGDCAGCHNTTNWTSVNFDHAGVTNNCTQAGCHVDGHNTPPLGRSGSHFATNTSCQDCHSIGGTFTPHTTVKHADFTSLTPCASCHDGAVHDGVTVTGKNTPHIPTNVPSATDCTTCHTGSETSLSWTGGLYHSKVTVTSGCTTCHDGTLTATGAQKKTPAHVATSNNCEKCHGTAAWFPLSGIDHTQVTGTCVSCHDGAAHDGHTISGKGTHHMGTSNACDACHTDSASSLLWTSTPTAGNMPHAQITSTTPCTTCHASGAPSSVVDGMTVQGRPAKKADNTAHPAIGDCVLCHSTSSWLGASFSHTGVTSGCSASGCHTDGNTTAPLGRSGQHFATNTNCQDCHNVGGTFTPHTTVKHADFTALRPCASCHDGGTHDGITVGGTSSFAGHIPTNVPTATDCGTCHVGSETTLNWAGGKYHTKVTVTSGCTTCHADGRATSPIGRSANHFATNTNCQDCHNTTAWTPRSTVRHSDFTTLRPCATCHDGATHDGVAVTGKNFGHIATNIPTATDCGTCHVGAESTLSWTSGQYHNRVTVTNNCTSCHADARTSSPLGRSGQHFATNTNCQDCHYIGGAWTPRKTVAHVDFTAPTPCASCHDGATHDGITVTGKSTPHIPTNLPSATDCATCHTGAQNTLSWTGGLYHSKVTVTSGCTSCHDGTQTAAGAQAKGTNHVASSNTCEKCHGTAAWSPLSAIDHTQVTGSCVSCHDNAAHDGLTIGGKGPQHMGTSNLCETCHTDSASSLLWTSTPTAGNMPHAQITSTTPCTTCHATGAPSSVVDGMTVQGRPVLDGHGNAHVATGDCVNCHNTSNWTSASFNHTGVSSGCTAVGCHTDGRLTPPLGRSAQHFATNTNCQDCHNIGGTFTPHSTVKHADFTTLTPCASCHDGAVHDGITVTGTNAGHIPTNVPGATDCATCHVGAQTTLSWTGGQYHSKVTVTTGCTSCHADARTSSPLGRSANHFATNTKCQDCHYTGNTFTPHTTVKHADFTTLTPCKTCHDGAVHDGVTVTGKTTNHIPTTADCAGCHVGAETTLNWVGGTFDHTGTSTGCASCHDAVHASGRGAQHIGTSTVCEACHTNSATTKLWTSTPTAGNVPHGQITSTTPCTTCHATATGTSFTIDGMTITGRPLKEADGSTHPTTGDCVNCHGTTSWQGAVFNHSGVTSGCSASGCHTDGNVSSPLGRSASHFATNTNCQDCHNIGSAFSPRKTMKHADLTALTPCASCHDGAVHDGVTVMGTSAFPGHIPTNFPAPTDCTTCHTGAENTLSFAGGQYHSKVVVTSNCTNCHTDGRASSPLGRAATHIATNSRCQDCHTTTAWTPAKSPIQHGDLTSLVPCLACHDNAAHDGNPIAGKGGQHIASSSLCQNCHNTSVWTPHTTVDHTQVTGTCVSCHDGAVHDGITIGGRGGQHFASSNTCDGCHTDSAATLSWLTTPTAGAVNHLLITVTTPCTTCHATGAGTNLTVDGMVVTGRPLKKADGTAHPGASDCGTCHSMTAWTPATGFDHTGVNSGCTAAGCHVDGNASSPMGRGANHIATNTNCQDCHNTGVAWTPRKTMAHADLTALTPCATCHNGATHDGIVIVGTNSGHIATNIPSATDCGTCHVGAQNTLSFAGGAYHANVTVTSQCTSCHTDGRTSSPIGRAATHIGTNTRCQDCHTTTAWTPAKATINHADITALTPCLACHDNASHDGNVITGKSGQHIATTSLCQNCHNTSVWRPATSVDHTQVSGTCLSCHDNASHDGQTIAGRSAQHIPNTSNTCDACHTNSASTLSWTSAPTAGNVNHAYITVTAPCTTCHATTQPNKVYESMTVQARPALKGDGQPHPNTGDCGACHSMTTWTPAVNFDHNGVVNGCSAGGCHVDGNTSPPLGRGAQHIATNTNCQDCHAIGTTFTPHTTVKHADITTLTPCASCHNGTVRDGITISGLSNGHIPVNVPSATDCTTCHVGAQTSLSWAPGVYHTHVTVTTGCLTCHSGTYTSQGAQPKNVGHITSSNNCEKCHSTSVFKPAVKVDHNELTLGSGCYSCHNNTTAQGKGPAHIKSSNTCDSCHKTSASTQLWVPVNAADVDHTQITTLTPCSSCHDGASHDGMTIEGKDPQHLTTSNICENCHTGNTVAPSWAIPSPAGVKHTDVVGTCYTCHQDNGTKKTGLGTTIEGRNTTRHIATNTMCADCHSTSAWSPYTQVNHADVTGVCTSCHDGLVHDGVTVQGRPNDAVHNNVNTQSKQCDDCHVTTTWVTTVFDHTGITTGCATCHATTLATNKPNDKVHLALKATAPCETCHKTTLAWTVTAVDHTQFTTTTPCANCHDGTTATHKPADTIHNQTTSDCVNCHATTSWVVTFFDHTGITGACSGCHNGTTATGKTQATHFVTVRECNYCHSTSAWSVPITSFAHQAANFTSMKIGSHRAYATFTCKTCHVGNAESTAYVTAGYAGHCAGCHAVRSTYLPSSDEVWKADSHSSHNPNTLASHIDCGTTCHNSTGGTISIAHRVSSSSF